MQKVILSLKPKYAKMILKGKKFFELRRRVPKQPFKHILIYATKPVGMMIGEVAVKEIFKLPLDELWKKTKSSNGLTKQEFFKYFDGMEDGYAIELWKNSHHLWRFPVSIHYYGHKKAPQNFAYSRVFDPEGKAYKCE